MRGAADLTGLAGAEDGVEAYVVSGRAAISAAAKLGLGSILEGGVEARGGVELGLRVAAHRREATAYVAIDGRVGAFFDALPAASLPRASSRRGARRPKDESGDAAGGDAGSLLNPDKFHRDTEVVASGTVALRMAPGPRVLAVEVTAVAGVGGNAPRAACAHRPVDPRRRRSAARLAERSHERASARRARPRRGQQRRRRRASPSPSTRGNANTVGRSAPDPGRPQDHVRPADLHARRAALPPVGGVWERRMDCEVA